MLITLLRWTILYVLTQKWTVRSGLSKFFMQTLEQAIIIALRYDRMVNIDAKMFTYIHVFILQETANGDLK